MNEDKQAVGQQSWSVAESSGSRYQYQSLRLLNSLYKPQGRPDKKKNLNTERDGREKTDPGNTLREGVP